MNNRHILERAVANAGPMTEAQRRAIWAKRAHPQATNPQLMQIRPGGAMPARPTGPQADIITRPVAPRFVPPDERGASNAPHLAVQPFVPRTPPPAGRTLPGAPSNRPGVTPPPRVNPGGRTVLPVPRVRPVPPDNAMHWLQSAAALRYLAQQGVPV